METGDLGLIGQAVVLLVEVEPHQEQGTVTHLFPQMVDWSVLDQELKIRLATLQHVQSVCIFELQ